MDQALHTTSDTITLPREQYDALIAENSLLKTSLKELTQKTDWIQQELDKFRKMLFAPSSERFLSSIDPTQISLGLEGAENKAPEPSTETLTITCRKGEAKNKPGHARLELPESLPREVTVIEPTEDVTGWKKIGEESSEYLARHRGSTYVKRIVRPKYAAPDGEGIVIGTLPLMPIHKGNADASIIAFIITGKFVDHLPYYRQAQMFKREGVTIAESTMIGWVRAACRMLEPLYDLHKKQFLTATYIQADETPIPVLSQEAAGSTHKGYFWVYFDPSTGNVVFEYQHGRGRDGPTDFLKEFKGTLQTDGYSVYDIFERDKGMTLLACFAHTRRKYTEAKQNDSARAEEMLTLIQKLYTIERDAKVLKPDFDAIRELRQKKALPALTEIESWLKKNVTETLPKSAIGMAIAYTLNLWPRLIRYIHDGRYQIDNNLIENSIRPTVIGKKNWLFAGSHDAAQRSAMIYSFVGTCKQLQIDPLTYLEDVIGRLPYFKKNDDLSVLLPANWKQARQVQRST
jgi:transposase